MKGNRKTSAKLDQPSTCRCSVCSSTSPTTTLRACRTIPGIYNPYIHFGHIPYPIIQATRYHTRRVYHTPFQAPLLDSREGANTEPYVFGKLSARCSQRQPFGTDTIPTIPTINTACSGDTDHGKSAKGVLILWYCDILYTVYGTTYTNPYVPLRSHPQSQQSEQSTS